MDIQQTRILVAGGASGLGAATAELLASKGGIVTILDLQKHPSLPTFLGSVTEEADVQNAIQHIEQSHGPIQVAINCAGIAPPMKVYGKKGVHSLEHFQKIIGINLIGTFNVVRLAAESMAKNDVNEQGERGVIINTASVAAFDGQMGQAAYAASKAGVAGMTLPIARDLASLGIRVMTIAPGIFKTPLMASLPEEAQASLALQVPFPPRLGKPSEFARLAEHILANTMLNGETIRLDGAIRMGMK